VKTTRSDDLAAAVVAAAGGGGTGEGTTRLGAQPRGGARPRARVPGTESDDKGLGFLGQVWADLRGAWVWTAEPMSRAEVLANRIPSPDLVPDGSAPLRWAWAVWMHLVAIPVTWVLLPVANHARPLLLRQLLRGLVWIFQHPARTTLAAAVGGPIGFLWIAN
jgi:hypothetical protein